ncbi:MAG: DNA alkylation repair protein [Candidatus Krumholzibacteria bacterium]|nr:DNA alkylation repair protein [Candidatus Krumholzibacteria bacterium]
MTLAQTLAALKKEGTDQNRKVYGHHGVTGAMYGVSYAALKKLKKSIGTDHALACGLWQTGNHDARILACMVADPAAMSARDLDTWLREIDNYVLCDAFAELVARSGQGLRKFEIWKKRKSEFASTAGWNALSSAATYEDGAALSQEFVLAQIAHIEAHIHDQPNRTRHSMNQALICLGAINGTLAKQAKAAAKRIGRVQVDHGQTSCKTPDAGPYIDKVLAHRAGKAKK